MTLLPVTASILHDLTICEMRVHLDAHGGGEGREPVSAFVRMLWQRGSRHEDLVIAELDAPIVDLSDLAPGERERETAAAMAARVPLIRGGRIVADDLVGVPDLLRLEDGRYVPGDIKSGIGEEDGSGEGGTPRLAYGLQLALYADILLRIGEGRRDRGFIWDIRREEVAYDLEAPLGPRRPASLNDEYERLAAQARAILAGTGGATPAASAACKLCHWRARCMATLRESDDLTLVAQLGRSLRAALSSSVHSVADLAALDPDDHVLPRGKSGFPGLGADRLRRFQARARLLTTPGARPYLTKPTGLAPRARELFFDIEVDPLRSHTYLHGVVERLNGDTAGERFVAFFAEDETPAAERDAFAQAFAYLDADPQAVIYYWSKYERTTYRALALRHPSVCSPEQIETLFDPARAVDLLYDIVMKCSEWPTNDHSIKTLAKYLGFAWRDNDPSGANSIEWFDRWTRSRDPALRQRIIDYNEDDCLATRVVLDGLLGMSVKDENSGC